MLLPTWEDLVDGQKEGVIEHAWEQFLKDWRGLLNAWVGIDLDEIGLALLV